MLSVVMVNVTYKPYMLNVIMLNVIMLNVTYKPYMLIVVMLSVFMLSVFMLSVFMLSVFLLSVFLLSVVMLNVVAPVSYGLKMKLKVERHILDRSPTNVIRTSTFRTNVFAPISGRNGMAPTLPSYRRIHEERIRTRGRG